MISALYRYPKKRRREIARLWAGRSHLARAVKRLAEGIDADTARRRALRDARGQIEREGITFQSGREIPWHICRSRRGRVDHFDVIVNGKLWRTGGQRKIARWLGRAK